MNKRITRKQVSFRVTPDELEKLNQKVSQTEYSREGYLRDLIKRNYPISTPKIDYNQVITQLQDIAKSMNHIAATANSAKFIDVDKYNNNLKLLDRIIAEIMEEIKKIDK